MSEKLYERYFAEPLFECGFCGSCSSRFNCFKENLSANCKKMNEAIDKFNKFMEACPENSKEKNGQCAKADNSGYLKNVCPTGSVWDPSQGSLGKCIKHVDKK